MYPGNLAVTIPSDYQFHSKSGIEERQSIMQGRPYGGVAVMWHDSMSKHIWPIECDSRRVCAIKGSMNGMNTIVVSVYMPCDNQLMQECNREFSDTIDMIEILINKETYDSFIICGDWNTNTARQTAQGRLFRDFLIRNAAKLCWEHEGAIIITLMLIMHLGINRV